MSEKKDYVKIQTFDDPHYAGAGWDLIRITYREQIDHTDQTRYSSNGCSFSHRVYSRPYKVPVYVMGQTRDQFIIDEKEKFDDLAKQLNKIKQEKNELDKKYKELEQSEKSYKEMASKYNANFYDAVKSKDDWINKAHMMERDIAKIRSAIGEIRMNEILGGSK